MLRKHKKSTPIRLARHMLRATELTFIKQLLYFYKDLMPGDGEGQSGHVQGTKRWLYLPCKQDENLCANDQKTNVLGEGTSCCSNQIEDRLECRESTGLGETGQTQLLSCTALEERGKDNSYGFQAARCIDTSDAFMAGTVMLAAKSCVRQREGLLLIVTKIGYDSLFWWEGALLWCILLSAWAASRACEN